MKTRFVFFVFDDSIKKIRNATPIKARAEGKYFELYTESLWTPFHTHTVSTFKKYF